MPTGWCADKHRGGLAETAQNNAVLIVGEPLIGRHRL